MTTLSISTNYNFSVYATSVLGTNYKAALLKSILDYSTALKYDNIVLLHKQIYPYLPEGTVSDPTRYQYYLFQVGNKEMVIADVWIINSTIEVATETSYSLRLLNVTASQVSMVTDQLRLLGISYQVS